MSWIPMLLFGDIGQQFTLDDIEEDVAHLRAQLNKQRSTLQSRDDALVTLRREVTDLQLVVAELSRLLVANDTLPREAVERIVRGLERRGGQSDSP